MNECIELIEHAESISASLFVISIVSTFIVGMMIANRFVK